MPESTSVPWLNAKGSIGPDKLGGGPWGSSGRVQKEKVPSGGSKGAGDT